jgi:hypothetical protein
MNNIEKRFSEVVLEEIREGYAFIHVKESFELYKKLATLREDYDKELFKEVETKVKEYLGKPKDSGVRITPFREKDIFDNYIENKYNKSLRP